MEHPFNLEKEGDEFNILLDLVEFYSRNFMHKLDKTTKDLDRQKELNQMFISTLKEELERTTKIKSEVLQKFEDLRVAYMSSHQRFSAELQAEKDKNEALQLQLEQLKVSHQVSLSSQEEKMKQCNTEVVRLIVEKGSLQKQVEHLNKLLEEKNNPPQDEEKTTKTRPGNWRGWEKKKLV